jgi:DNA polymerase-3 subunit epsilon
VVDTETTGLGPDREVIEVAVVDPSGRLAFGSRIRPENPPEPEAVRIHGLDRAALASAPSFPEVLPFLLEQLRGNTLLAYNAPFDRLSLQLTARRHGIELPPLIWKCLLERYVRLRGFRASLRTACEMEGLSVPSGPHRATTDAHLAWRLVRALTDEPG